MFIFETSKINILYTGDIRLSVGAYKKMKRLHRANGYPKVFDNIYLDTTFLDYSYKYFPSQFDSFKEIYHTAIKWLELNSNNIILLHLPARYGSEYVFIELAKRLNMPVHVSTEVFESYKYLSEIDKAVTLDLSATKIHACEYNKSCEAYHSGNNKFKLVIKPTAMFWRGLKKCGSILWRQGNSVRVCYSSHASYDELVDMLYYFKPKIFTPCVVLKNSEFSNVVNKIMHQIQCGPKEEIQNQFVIKDSCIKKDVYVLKRLLKRKATQTQNSITRTITYSSGSDEADIL